MPTQQRVRINRFVVMAMLQAARAKKLGMPLPAAHSWGLNRAIFFAAAKRGFRGKPEGESGAHGEGKPTVEATEAYRLGDDFAYRDPASTELQFMIGGKPQTDQDFQHQIASRFGGAANFRSAWNECEKVVGEYDKDVLGSRSQFYNVVYKPRRDALVKEWSDRFGSASG